MRLAVLVLFISAVTASAHHNISTAYDQKKEVKLEGKVVQILLRNPHSFLQIEVSDPDGNIERWSLEFPKSANSLLQQGIEPGMLKTGDRVAITINPSFKPADKRGKW